MTDQSLFSLEFLRARSLLPTHAKFLLWLQYRHSSYPWPAAGVQLEKRREARIYSQISNVRVATPNGTQNPMYQSKWVSVHLESHPGL